MIDIAPAVRLFVGGHASRVQGERQDLLGDRMFSAAHYPQCAILSADGLTGMLDSGAFTDSPEQRLTPQGALTRQLAWEQRASTRWGFPFQAAGFVSYDRLIDETWVAGEKHKRRWTVQAAESAVRETVEAAHYLAGQRIHLAPRRLILACQGVDGGQYDECTTEVLKVAQLQDWIGLGGWCILGRQKRWIPTFWQALRLVLPRIARAGVTHVHIFGVLYEPALGGLAWLADQIGLTVSTDNAGPILNCTWADKKKSGARFPYWRDNVNYWIQTLANLRTSIYYREPPRSAVARQETFL